jgi:ribonuclease D
MRTENPAKNPFQRILVFKRSGKENLRSSSAMAQRRGCKNKNARFFILHNAHLVIIAKFKPRSMEDLGRIRGIGRSKINQLGLTILSIVS